MLCPSCCFRTRLSLLLLHMLALVDDYLLFASSATRFPSSTIWSTLEKSPLRLSTCHGSGGALALFSQCLTAHVLLLSAHARLRKCCRRSKRQTRAGLSFSYVETPDLDYRFVIYPTERPKDKHGRVCLFHLSKRTDTGVSVLFDLPNIQTRAALSARLPLCDLSKRKTKRQTRAGLSF